MLWLMLPYPNGRPDLYRTVFCLRERAVVRKQPQCYTCSWCETGSETMTSDEVAAGRCATHRKPIGSSPRWPETACIDRHAA